MKARNKTGFNLYETFKFYTFLLLKLAAGLFVILIISVLALRWINPAFTAFMLIEDWGKVKHEMSEAT